ncbi:hypothetical protein ELQ35_10815 [Peribacillus cavernae]|uniref:Nucleotidyltransferase domain-containing protein n=1 Tax=Peribacillus cavernae TaxID=1674310 RepID=A0A433HKT0_9BACI|nr:nucleotidyltransferase domain-containing protein [Peribacillus cavernae]MDQ0218017.1 putative nucleotidyltransferase [Peribacillus cavernae]RUQ28938.1 hypothetical protein ELQ35_10815 [Peribacillus cavernae]
MNEKAGSLLKSIEKENEIVIVMAAETGSHSFDLESPESDRDIRFLFVRANIREYLSIELQPDVISLWKSDYEIEGWDIFKAFRLILKSNPNLFEWFHSRTYEGSNEVFMAEMKSLMASHYSLRNLGQHYYHMCVSNLNQLSKNSGSDKKGHKTMVQAARCYLMLSFLLQKQALPPLAVSQLLKEVNMDWKLSSVFEGLFQAKRSDVYFSKEKILKIGSLFEGELISAKNLLITLPEGTDMEDRLNKTIWECLDIGQGGK